MATIDDQASAFEEQFLKEALNLRKPAPLKTGRCLNCGESTEHSFCDTSCREDHLKRVAFSKGAIQP